MSNARMLAHDQRYANDFHESLATQLSPAASWEASLDAFNPLRGIAEPLAIHKFGISVVGCIAGAIGMSQLTYLFNPLLGAYANVAALAVLATLALKSEKARTVAIAVSILPVVNMVVQSRPYPDALFGAATFYAAVLLLSIIYHKVFALELPAKPATLGRKQYFYLVPVIVLAGELLATLAYQLLSNNIAFVQIPFALVAGSLIAFIATEELFFRGLIQRLASDIMPAYLSMILTVSLATVMIIPLGSLSATIFAAISSTILCIMYFVEPNLVFTAAANAILKSLFFMLVITVR